MSGHVVETEWISALILEIRGRMTASHSPSSRGGRLSRNETGVVPSDHQVGPGTGGRECPGFGASWVGGPIPEASRYLYGGAIHFRCQTAIYDREDMMRWIPEDRRMEETPGVDAFLEEVIAVCRRHGFSMGHEDTQGAFQVLPFSEDAADWLRWVHDRAGIPRSTTDGA